MVAGKTNSIQNIWENAGRVRNEIAHYKWCSAAGPVIIRNPQTARRTISRKILHNGSGHFQNFCHRLRIYSGMSGNVAGYFSESSIILPDFYEKCSIAFRIKKNLITVPGFLKMIGNVIRLFFETVGNAPSRIMWATSLFFLRLCYRDYLKNSIRELPHGG